MLFEGIKSHDMLSGQVFHSWREKHKDAWSHSGGMQGKIGEGSSTGSCKGELESWQFGTEEQLTEKKRPLVDAIELLEEKERVKETEWDMAWKKNISTRRGSLWLQWDTIHWNCWKGNTGGCWMMKRWAHRMVRSTSSTHVSKKAKKSIDSLPRCWHKSLIGVWMKQDKLRQRAKAS